MSKTKHKWSPWSDECPECGTGENEVYTISDDGAYDGDSVKCVGCGHTGYVSADDDGCTTVWPEEQPAITGSAETIHKHKPKGKTTMPNRPQHPPEGSRSLHMAPGVCRPTILLPRSKDPMADYRAMRQHCEDLEEDVRRLTIAVGKYECAKCGAERSEHRGIHAVSSDPVCNECGEYWL